MVSLARSTSTLDAKALQHVARPDSTTTLKWLVMRELQAVEMAFVVLRRTQMLDKHRKAPP